MTAVPKPVKPKKKKKKRDDYKGALWTAFSAYIRRNGVCEFHKILNNYPSMCPCKCNGVLQACHKISRSKLVIKYDERNVFAGCSGSNTWAHWNQVEWDRLWRKMFPEDVDYLERKLKMKYVGMKALDYRVKTQEYKDKLK